MKAVVFGLQWGDEGKGKITTYLSREYDIVVRYSGGSNAGHTVEYGDVKIIHHLIPSLHLNSNVKGYIGPGVVIDVEVFMKELEELRSIDPGVDEKIRVSSLSHIVLPLHKEIDGKLEDMKGEARVGTTRRGIGPAYADKANRLGIRAGDFRSLERLIEKLELISRISENLYGITPMNSRELIQKYEVISRYVLDPIDMKRDIENSRVLFEGTQGVLLDLDMGTYPYVTSGHCNTTGVWVGIGFPVKLNKYIGVFKAYTTRVGEGPFPTEVMGSEAEELRNRGKEFGATTGRPRRCGWLDLPLLRYAVEVSGCTEMIMTKADVLNGISEVKVCVGYRYNGRILDVPPNLDVLDDVKPMYETLKGWKDLSDPNFHEFVEYISKMVGVTMSHVSTGPRVDDIEIWSDGDD